jgi:DNA-binding MarR family transcriptional regulator
MTGNTMMRPLPAPGELSQCNCTAMRKASRRLSSMYDEALAPVGLKSTQFSIISEIHRSSEKPPTMSELAAAMVMDRSTLGQNLRPLERSRLVAMKSVPADRRRKHVVLTRRGQAKFAESYALWCVAQDRFEQSFGADEAADLRSLLLGIAGDPTATDTMSTASPRNQ